MINGLFKTELIGPRGPAGPSHKSTSPPAEWVDWFNYSGLCEYCGDIQRGKLEDAF